MIKQVSDLIGHQEWADAELWRAIERVPSAGADAEFMNRQHHIHLVQHAFLDIWNGRAVAVTKVEDFQALAELKEYARTYYRQAAEFLAAGESIDWTRRIEVEWFKKFPGVPTLMDTALQVALHTAQHRAQNAARLRSLGGDPPVTDFILWIAQGKPAANWS